MSSYARPLFAPIARALALALGTGAYFAVLLGTGWSIRLWAWFLFVALAVTPLAAWLRGRREVGALATALGGALLTLLLPVPASLAAGGAAFLVLLALLVPGVLATAAESVPV